jgi:hypothetical protein
MHDGTLDRIENKLDQLVISQNQLKISAAEHKQHEKTHQKNIDRFWDSTWPEVIEKMDGNSTRIAELEVELARIKTMVLVWGTVITALLGSFVTYYLEK